MSGSNGGCNGDGVIRIGRKGLKKFAFGDGPVFEVDVVTVFQQWVDVDNSFRQEEDPEGGRTIPDGQMIHYHQAAVTFVTELSRNTYTRPGDPSPVIPMLTVAEALDFLARLREQYDELAAFFRPKSRDKQESAATSAPVLQFSEEEAS